MTIQRKQYQKISFFTIIMSGFLCIPACIRNVIPASNLLQFQDATTTPPSIEINRTENNQKNPYSKTVFVDNSPENKSYITASSNIDSIKMDDNLIEYSVQSGDTVHSVAKHFNVEAEEISSSQSIAMDGFLEPGQILLIPERINTACSSDLLLPDSEIVYSKSSIDFNLDDFILNSKGYLSTYSQELPQGQKDASAIIYRVAINQSVNPLLLLSLIEFQSNWLYGKPIYYNQYTYPLGYIDKDVTGLYSQLRWAAGQLNLGYYGWREGSLTHLTFSDGSCLRISPVLNAGTVSLMYFFSQLMTKDEWENALTRSENFISLYERMFGDPWQRAKEIEPLIQKDLSQPLLNLPFEKGTNWNLTGGPHYAYTINDAKAALDFAPVGRHNCSESYDWITAPASGLVVRSENGIVVIDLDKDGFEQTGWVLFFVHVASFEKVPVGTYVETDDKIGHPSCEGGFSSGAHVHIARKYNGEWMMADGAVSFVLSGWRAVAGANHYEGCLIKDKDVVRASKVGSIESLITH